MNMGGMGGGGAGLPPQCLPGQQPGTPQQQPGIPPQMQSQQQEKLDNISKVKSLIGQLRESLNVTLKTAAQTLHHNTQIDNGGSSKGVDVAPPRFDKSLEEFYSTCDQIELHLKTSIECMNQYASSQRYLSITVAPTRTEPLATGDQVAPLTYPQFLATARHQVNYAKEIHDLLMSAASTLNNPE